MNEYLNCLKKYAVFAGRARRREYWMFVLFNSLISLGLGLVLGFVGAALNAPTIGGLAQLYTLAVLLPGIAVTVRRLHDIGKSGWWMFIALIPIVGWILLLVFFCRDGEPDENAFGPDPKA